MKWERVKAKSKNGEEVEVKKSPGGKGGGVGPGRRWGHTCNSVRNGVYVFGGYGKDNCQTNDVHILDPIKQTWTKPIMKGKPPTPRDSHSCTTVGTCLFVFGGTDGHRPLRDLVILDTATNTWIEPEIHGEGPAAREGHSAALLGHCLFIFGGCGKTEDGEDIYYNDLYILDTFKITWTRGETSGKQPSPRDSHSCSAWNNKIIVIGGEDESDSYLSDVYVLDADTLVWEQLKTTGQNLTSRAGHCTVPWGRHLFVFGGFTDDRNLYDDLHVLNLETKVWTQAVTDASGPSARFSVAGDCLDYKRGVLVFIGGCNKDLEGLDDLYYLHTEMLMENVPEEQKPEKLSLRKELKRKRQEHHVSFNNFEREKDIGTKNFSLYDFRPVEEKLFEAKITSVFHYGYTIESFIDGKHLRGLLFSHKPDFYHAVDDYLARKHMTSKPNAANSKGCCKSKLKVADTTKRPLKEDGPPQVPMDIEYVDQVVIGKQRASPSNQNIDFSEQYQHHMESAPLSSTPGVNCDQKNDTSSGFVNALQAVSTSFQQSALLPSTTAVHCDQKTGTGFGLGNALHKMPTSFQQSAPILSTPPLHCKEMTESGPGYANSLHMMAPAFQQSAPILPKSSIHYDPKNNTGLGLADASQQIPTSLQLSAPVDSTQPAQCSPKPEIANHLYKLSSGIQSTLVEFDSESNLELGFSTTLHSRKENADTPQPSPEGTSAITSLSLSCLSQSQSSPANQGSQPTQENVDHVEQSQEVCRAE